MAALIYGILNAAAVPFILCLALFLAPADAQAAPPVPVNAVHELTFTSSSTYSRPDAEVESVWTPNGSTRPAGG